MSKKAEAVYVTELHHYQYDEEAELLGVDHSLVICRCECGNEIKIRKTWYPGGVNDYGAFELKCDKCGKTMVFDVGRDVDASEIIAGATLEKRVYRD